MSSTGKEGIYSVLFNRIMDGTYKENTRLKESGIASEFGVSRTPIREVLRLLSQDGMVQLLPNKGAKVRPLTPDDIEEIYEIRKSLEVLALGFAIPRLNLLELMRFKDLILKMSQTDNYSEASTIDRDFHRYIVECSGKFRLINMNEQLLRLMQRFRYIGFHIPFVANRVTKEHLDLIENLMLRNIEQAKIILANHIEESKKATLQFIFSQGSARL